MFRIPSTGGSKERAAGASGREKVQLAVMAAMVVAIVGWWASRGARKAAERPPEVPYGIENMAEEERKWQVKREDVIALKKKEEREAATAGDEEAAPKGREVNPGLPDWEYKTADEISPEEYQELVAAERAEEVDRAKFLPMLDEFKPLEPDAVRAYRARVMDRVPITSQASFILPEQPDVEYAVVKADGTGFTARSAGGTERKFSWDELPVESLYAMAEQIAVTEGPRASEKDAFFLARLATLAGKPDEAAAHRERTVELDPRLAERAKLGPTTSLDYGILDEFSWSWDNPMRPTAKEASSVREDAPSIFHVYRYMRTLGPEGLAGVVEPPTRYELLQRRPVNYRGRVYTIKGRFIKRYKSTRWTRIDGHEEAGIRDIDFCFIRGAKWSGIYLVSVPRDTRRFGSSDMVRFTGVYIRRWPYLSQGQWKWIPWIAALDMEKVEIAPSRGLQIVGMGILVAAVVGVVLIFLYARHDARSAAKAREHRVARSRAQRDRIRRKVAEARSVGTSGRPDDAARSVGPSPDDAASKGEGPAGKSEADEGSEKKQDGKSGDEPG